MKSSVQVTVTTSFVSTTLRSKLCRSWKPEPTIPAKSAGWLSVGSGRIASASGAEVAEKLCEKVKLARRDCCRPLTMPSTRNVSSPLNGTS